MTRPTPAQDFTAGMVLLTAALWAAFGWGVWRLIRDTDLNDLGGTK